MENVEFILAEFGEERINNGGSSFDSEILVNPTYRTFKKYFPEASFVLYTDTYRDGIPQEFSQRVVADTPFDKEHYRWGSHCNDYYKVQGLLNSEADVSVALDSDMYAFTSEVKTLIPLTKKFGMCVPPNPRMQVRRDGDPAIALDANYTLQEDESRGNAAALNMSPISVSKEGRSSSFRQLLEVYLDIMETAPVRGPLAMWRAMWLTGLSPLMLPFQWCLCDNRVGLPNIILNDSGNEIILHVGHQSVAELYQAKGSFPA